MHQFAPSDVPVDVCVDIFCDICHKSMIQRSINVTMPEGLHLEDTAGYGSHYDGEKLDLDICDECLTIPIILAQYLEN